ncbi:MAG: lipoprotein [Nitrosomonas sp.]|nr:MAG: lipoprotein [Nitrosomonas sp.]
MRLFFCSTLIIYLLSACGNKGPLYLPKVEDQNRTPALSEEVDKK